MGEGARISQWTAILLERARRFGLSDDVLLTSYAAGDVTPFKIAEEQYYSYDEFFSYAKDHHEDLEAAIKNGYKMKFNTSGGIQTWLKEKFGFVPEQDFTFNPGKLTNLSLTTEQAQIVLNVLADNWVMLLSADGQEYIEADHDLAAFAKNGPLHVNLIIRSEYNK